MKYGHISTNPYGKAVECYPQTPKKRTRFIWYGGCQYRRRCDYHGRWVYIILFIGESKAQIEFGSGEQRIVDVDDAKFILKERTTHYEQNEIAP